MIKKKEVEPVTINGPDGTPLVTIPKYIVNGDIVELLRSLDDRDMHWERIADEAAAEIERLRTEVVRWREARDLGLEAGDDLRAEIERLRNELEGADRVANSFAQTACLRGARMQVMREWMKCTELMWNCTHRPWDMFIESRPDAAAWFDDEGVPR